MTFAPLHGGMPVLLTNYWRPTYPLDIKRHFKSIGDVVLLHGNNIKLKKQTWLYCQAILRKHGVNIRLYSAELGLSLLFPRHQEIKWSETREEVSKTKQSGIH